MSVNKKNIIVTGASGGIGYSIVEKLHAEGWKSSSILGSI